MLKKIPDLQKKAMTGAERMSASRERMTQEQRVIVKRENDWKLCINFLMSSSEFETFVKTNKLTRKLLEIGFKNAHEKYIAKLVFTVFNEFKLKIEGNLQDQMRSMFGMLIKQASPLILFIYLFIFCLIFYNNAQVVPKS